VVVSKKLSVQSVEMDKYILLKKSVMSEVTVMISRQVVLQTRLFVQPWGWVLVNQDLVRRVRTLVRIPSVETE